jgi:hypothetical protein
MSNTKRAGLARALATLLLPGALILTAPAASATAEPQPAITAGSGLPNKAQVEHLERLQIRGTYRNKAQIEHDERQPATAGVPSDGPPAPADTGFAVGILAALGVAAVTGGVVVLRRGRTGPAGA